MWFKNLFLYRLPRPWNMTRETLNDQLARSAFRPCAGSEASTSGFVAPQRENPDVLVHAVGGQWLLALASEQRLLPSSVVQQEVAERAEKIQEDEGYYPGRRALRELKERVTEEFLPRAFTRRRVSFAWIDPVNGWLVVDASSPNKADEWVGKLADCLDELPLKPVQCEKSPVSVMADSLLAGEAPDGFTLDRDCELKGQDEDKQTVRYVHHPLEGEGIADEIRAHLSQGKLPTRLAFTYDERLSFVLTDKLTIKKLAFLDVIAEQAEANADSAVSAAERFDADFALMTGELVRFIAELMGMLGGEKTAA